MIEERLRYVTYEVSSACDMDCGFCFSDWREQSQELGTLDAEQGISILAGYGLEAINFTGGEPLLRKDITDLIRHAKEEGLTTILTTNGILLEKKIGEIAPYLDFIGLPLDSADPLVHNRLRPTKSLADHHGHILYLIDLLHDQYGGIGLKVNTIVTGQNIDSIQGIGGLIDGKAVSWKLSHFTPLGHGRHHQSEYAVSPEQYQETVIQCRQAHPRMNIIASISHERDDCCRVLSADGHFLMPGKDGLVDLGDIKTARAGILLTGFNAQKHEYFLRKTYPGGKDGR
jgi:MoaA/NifB/PqqE/SkfB family radical SAM enzyme